MSPRFALLHVTLATLLLSAVPARAKKEPSPRKADEFLLAWVQGEANYALFT